MAIPKISPGPNSQASVPVRQSKLGVITRKGQVTIPAEFRHELGLLLGERVSMRIEGATVVLQRASDQVDELYGILADYAKPENRSKDIQEIVDEEDEAFTQAIVADVLDELETA